MKSSPFFGRHFPSTPRRRSGPIPSNSYNNLHSGSSCLRSFRLSVSDMASANGKGNVMNDVEAKGLNPGLIVLLLVGGLLLIFLVGNYALYLYAQKNLPPMKKKAVSKKKMRRERLKQGVSSPGE